MQLDALDTNGMRAGVRGNRQVFSPRTCLNFVLCTLMSRSRFDSTIPIKAKLKVQAQSSNDHLRHRRQHVWRYNILELLTFIKAHHFFNRDRTDGPTHLNATRRDVWS